MTNALKLNSFEGPAISPWWENSDKADEGEQAPPMPISRDRFAELVAGFLSRKPAAEAEFLDALRPFLRDEISVNFPGLWHQRADLQQSALLKACKMRDDRAEAERLHQSVKDLAKFLVDSPARALLRLERPVEQLWDAGEPPDLENRFKLERLLGIAASLPRGFARTMIAHARYEMGEGPPLEEALGIDSRSAQRRLFRAQAAVVKISRGEKVEVDDE